jgi:phage-related protein
MSQKWDIFIRTIDREMTFPASFYQTTGGHEPVRSGLLELDSDDRRVLGAAIAKVEFGWPIGLPSRRPMGPGLFEGRANIGDGRIGRVLFCLVEGRMVLPHVFIKKTRATPVEDLALARKRMKELS